MYGNDEMDVFILLLFYPMILYILSLILYKTKGGPKKDMHIIIGIGLFIGSFFHLYITLMMMYFENFEFSSAYFIPFLYIAMPYVLLYFRFKVNSEQREHIFLQYSAFASLQALLSLLLLGGILIDSDLHLAIRIGIALFSVYGIIHFTYFFLKRFSLKSKKRED